MFNEAIRLSWRLALSVRSEIHDNSPVDKKASRNENRNQVSNYCTSFKERKRKAGQVQRVSTQPENTQTHQKN